VTADQVVVVDWIAGSCQVNLMQIGPGCLIRDDPGLKVNKSFSLLLICFVYFEIEFKTENLNVKLQNSNQNFRLYWISLTGFRTTRLRSSTLRLG